jgi:hypothetical protein
MCLLPQIIILSSNESFLWSQELIDEEKQEKQYNNPSASTKAQLKRKHTSLSISGGNPVASNVINGGGTFSP